MNIEHRRFWLEHNTADTAEAEALLPQLARVFPAGGIVQGTETSLKRLWPLVAKHWKREQVVLMGKLATWFQGMDLTNPESFLDRDRWASFMWYETKQDIPSGPWGIDAESWTQRGDGDYGFLDANPGESQIQRAVRRFRNFGHTSDWPLCCYHPSLWADDHRRIQLCTGIFGKYHRWLRWHDGRHADPTPTVHAVSMADQSDMLSQVGRFTKVNCGTAPDSQYNPWSLAALWSMLSKPVYCYTSSVASTGLFCDAMETFEKGST